jgi:hypothetical protein
MGGAAPPRESSSKKEYKSTLGRLSIEADMADVDSLESWSNLFLSRTELLMEEDLLGVSSMSRAKPR